MRRFSHSRIKELNTKNAFILHLEGEAYYPYDAVKRQRTNDQGQEAVCDHSDNKGAYYDSKQTRKVISEEYKIAAIEQDRNTKMNWGTIYSDLMDIHGDYMDIHIGYVVIVEYHPDINLGLIDWEYKNKQHISHEEHYNHPHHHHRDHHEHQLNHLVCSSVLKELIASKCRLQ